MTNLGWYLRRLSRMGPTEIAGRTRDAWRIRQWRGVPHSGANPSPLPNRQFGRALHESGALAVPDLGATRLIATARRIMDGHHEYLGVARDDLVNPDWAFDPGTGRRAPTEAYAFDIAVRDEAAVGNIKRLWEPSRHQHLTVLAGAYAVTGDERYAERVADHLKSWWSANPPMRGVHWASGIELGIRLISWVWIRRLLTNWPGAPELFENNPEALHHIWYHQRWLATFPSRGSSANNHIIAEAAGQLVAASAFAWFPESGRWQAGALNTLDNQLQRNTFDSGLNRELASEYHGLVLELGLVAAIEAQAAGVSVPQSTWQVLLRMTDSLAAVLDNALRPPRQGDADDGHALVVDGEGTDRWASLLATGQAVFGRLNWWPALPDDDVRTALLGGLADTPIRLAARRPGPDRPAHFADAGMTILRARGGGSHTAAGEIWCRCDGGPHGFLSIAAHAHADALSIEVRCDGVDVLADPGTYCYHGESEWRSYFRSTVGHNTLELDGMNQSRSGGPFMWTRQARTTVLVAPSEAQAGAQRWQAEHDGYHRRGDAVRHRRTVELDDSTGELRVDDEIVSGTSHGCLLAYHLGPSIDVHLVDNSALLSWNHAGTRRTGILVLPGELAWTVHRGEYDPPLGWYSPSFGRRIPTYTLLGAGIAEPSTVFTTYLRFGASPSRPLI